MSITLPEIATPIIYYLIDIQGDPSQDPHVLHAKKHLQIFRLKIEDPFISGFHFHMNAKAIYIFSLVCKEWYKHTQNTPIQDLFEQTKKHICKWKRSNGQLTWHIIDYKGRPHPELNGPLLSTRDKSLYDSFFHYLGTA